VNFKRIELGLFDLLIDVGPIVNEIAGKEAVDEKRAFAITKARDKLLTFVKNFLIQFFYVGYGFLMRGFHPDTITGLQKFFQPTARPDTTDKLIVDRQLVPSKMIEALVEYVEIEKDAMGDPYTREVRHLRKLYCEFLPRLFDAFREDGSGTIDNYSAILEKINQALTDIQAVCSRSVS